MDLDSDPPGLHRPGLTVNPAYTEDRVAEPCLRCIFIGIWIEKGMGLIIPGFVPTPLGDVVEYLPTLAETLVCLGIWAFGILIYSWMLHVAIPILSGRLQQKAE